MSFLWCGTKQQHGGANSNEKLNIGICCINLQLHVVRLCMGGVHVGW